MVMRLTRPDFDDVKLVDEIVGQRKRGVNGGYFERIRSGWKLRIQEYIQVCGNPESLTKWQEALQFKTRFLTLYNSPSADSVQKPIIEKLRERTLQMCPSCGEDGTPNTLDHYLPKSEFPDFSVTTANLFPMCDTCQGVKLGQVLDEGGERIFLHPYFDSFLDQQVLELRIGEPFSAPGSMDVVPMSSLPRDLRELVGRHIEGLDIKRRYYHFFREQYIHLLGSAADIREASLDMTQQLTLFRNKARRKSVNCWGYIFYESVLSNPPLIAYLETANLPALESWALAFSSRSDGELGSE